LRELLCLAELVRANRRSSIVGIAQTTGIVEVPMMQIIVKTVMPAVVIMVMPMVMVIVMVVLGLSRGCDSYEGHCENGETRHDLTPVYCVLG